MVAGLADALMTDIGPGKSECFLLQTPKVGFHLRKDFGGDFGRLRAVALRQGGSCSGNFEIISENAANDVLVRAVPLWFV